MSAFSDQVREMFKAGDDIRDAGLTTPKEIQRFDEFQIPHDLKIQAVALNSAAFYIDEMLHQYMQDYMPLHGTEQEEEMMDMRKYITEEYPPTFLMTATEDPLKGLAGMMAIALADKNVPFVYHYYVGKEEQIGHVFHLNIRQKDATLCNDEECNFFLSFI